MSRPGTTRGWVPRHGPTGSPPGLPVLALGRYCRPMLALLGVHLQVLADHLLAPFATLGVVAGGGAILGAIIGNVEAVDEELSDAEGDAHVQSRYNDGLVIGGSVALIPVALLVIEALNRAAAGPFATSPLSPPAAGSSPSRSPSPASPRSG